MIPSVIPCYCFSCNKEYVEIRDGGTEYSPLIGRYCKSAPTTQYSTDNMVFIKFFTDTDEPKNGFKANISLGYCGGTVRGLSGAIVFKNPEGNVKEHNCVWHIVGPVDHYLLMNFTRMQVSCLDSSLAIYEEYKEFGISKNGEHTFISRDIIIMSGNPQMKIDSGFTFH